jgi:GDPmannose 4,6-dehydratase
MAVAKICLLKQEKIYLGNLNAQRDWGHAKDFVEGMWLILQQPTPEDFVLATGITTTVREFVKKAFMVLGVEIEFEGVNENEVGRVKKSHDKFILKEGSIVVEVDPKYFRPTEVELLIGDSTKAREKLNWSPNFSLDQLVEQMVISDLKKLN